MTHRCMLSKSTICPRISMISGQHGVTTVNSVGDPTEHILRMRADRVDGAGPGPRVLSLGCGITRRDGHPDSTVFAENPSARA